MPIDRRYFLQSSTLLAAGLFLQPKDLSAQMLDGNVRIGIIGVGLRGQNHLELCLARPDVTMVAICDIDDGMLDDAKLLVKNSGKPMPEVYTGDDFAYRKLLDRKTLMRLSSPRPGNGTSR